MEEKKNASVYNKLILAIEHSLRLEEVDTQRDIQFWSSFTNRSGAMEKIDRDMQDICLDVYRVIKQTREQVEELMKSFTDIKVDAPSVYRLTLEVLAEETEQRIGRLEGILGREDIDVSKETKEHISSILPLNRDLLSDLRKARGRAAMLEEILAKRKRGSEL